jgi:hypothetical protein
MMGRLKSDQGQPFYEFRFDNSYIPVYASFQLLFPTRNRANKPTKRPLSRGRESI